jgi:spore coat polysaccharide biosynthesis protein SpsF
MAANIVIIQARTGSTRLPGKILLKILGKEIILHLIDRVIAAGTVDHVIIATTLNPQDDIIIDLIKDYHKNVSLFRGSEEDVLDRYYQAASAAEEKYNDDLNIIRITSDCPLIDPKVIDLHIAEFKSKQVDYLSSRINKRTWPHGMELEVFSYAVLRDAWKNATTLNDREHVTPYLYRTNRDNYKLYELTCFKDLSGYRLTVDYPEDFTVISRIFASLYNDNPLFGLEDIIAFLEKNKDIAMINAQRINTTF